jgi:hypothetical protein
MAARKRAAMKPASAAIEDISTQRSLFRAHPPYLETTTIAEQVPLP